MKKKILIVSANYYPNIQSNLLDGAQNYLKKHYNLILIKNIDRTEVPGVFEIPVTIARQIKKYDGFIALGCVIKGQTPHFDFISKATIDAIMKLSIDYKKPIGNGIITCLNKKQAILRSKTKGQESANAVCVVLKKL
tara:strand:+ start:66 stop:476 length:411 start_codon:yes stop_codon:yes gene_type:complete